MSKSDRKSATIVEKINCNWLALTCREVQCTHFPDVMIDSSRGKNSRNILKLTKSPFLHIKSTQTAGKMRLWKQKICLSRVTVRGFNALSEVHNFRDNTSRIHYIIHSRLSVRHRGGGGNSRRRAITAARRRSWGEPLADHRTVTYQYRARAEHNTADTALGLTLTDRHQRNIQMSDWCFMRWT